VYGWYPTVISPNAATRHDAIAQGNALGMKGNALGALQRYKKITQGNALGYLVSKRSP
jgi:hypothetical protein